MRGENVLLKLLDDVEFRNNYFKLYQTGILDYCASISPYVQEECTNIMDIGCGIGLVPLLLFNECKVTPNFWLLDKSIDIKEMDRAHINGYAGGFHSENYIFTASLQVTYNFFCMNGIETDRIHLLEVDQGVFDKVPELDLILSRNSWGFHYPISTYIDDVCLKLKKTGRVIIDVRKDSDGLEILSDKFSYVKIASDSKKSNTVIASNSPI